VLRGEERGPSAGGDTQLVVDVLHMVLDRFGVIDRELAIALFGSP